MVFNRISRFLNQISNYRSVIFLCSNFLSVLFFYVFCNYESTIANWNSNPAQPKFSWMFAQINAAKSTQTPLFVFPFIPIISHLTKKLWKIYQNLLRLTHPLKDWPKPLKDCPKPLEEKCDQNPKKIIL